ncbi:3'-5' exoribonuclease [Vibrio phage PVP-XSN]|uniref:3'-5' exoribonuclease n=1 Tax=Vibrio phage PVP-XSN TaxID=3056214 RepID=A0AAX3Y3Z3_9CAUD|nr:3'-5' exoribonuclease [Vibrio phage PVP-XSN]
MTKREQPEVTKIAVIDIETLAKSEKSKIASIGCVILDVKTLQILPDYFYMPININDQKGRVNDESTMLWWFKQALENKKAFDAAFANPEACNIKLALNGLSDFLGRVFGDEPVNMFGNGPEFDNVILADAFAQYGIKLPWDYWNNQSVRTMLLTYRMISGNQQPDIKFKGIKHHALYDAQHEAEIIAESLRFIRDGVNLVKTTDSMDSVTQKALCWDSLVSLLKEKDGVDLFPNNKKSLLENVFNEINRVYQSESEAMHKVDLFDSAIRQVANHVGACCGGVDVPDYEMRSYCATSAEIIRKIDEMTKKVEVNPVDKAKAKYLEAKAEYKKLQADGVMKREMGEEEFIKYLNTISPVPINLQNESYDAYITVRRYGNRGWRVEEFGESISETL